MKQIFIIALLLFFGLELSAQEKKREEKQQTAPKHGILINLLYAYQQPGADLAKRFEYNSAVGINVSYKSYKNWLFGAELNYMYGSRVKENFALDSLMDKDYLIYDVNGNPAVIKLYERGFNVMLTAGKIILKSKKNENSGLMLRLGAGFLQHRIHYQTNTNLLPALHGDYLKGYDRLSNGFTSYAFLGYQHLDSKRYINLLAGVEFFNANTYNRRKFNYDSRSYDLKRRTDQLFGVKVGVIIPIFFKDRDKDNKEIFFK